MTGPDAPVPGPAPAAVSAAAAASAGALATPEFAGPQGAPGRPDHADRRRRVAELLAATDLDALLVTDLVNIRYLTGFTGSNAALLLTAEPAGTRFCTDGRYVVQAGVEVPDLPLVVDRLSDAALLADRRGRIGFEAAHVSVATHAAWPDADGLTATTGLVEGLRAVKDAGEVELLRRACAVADRALTELTAAGGLRPGRTERDVALDLDQRMRLLGAHDVSFETIVAAGANSAVPHHRPTGARLRTGDLVKIDFGAEVDGYHSDTTRTFVLGPAADWQRDLHGLVLAAQTAGRQAMRPGTTAGDVDAAARDLITDAGHGDDFSHGLGHGVGLEIHEAPGVGRGAAGIIRGDMCVTVEPGVYLPGRGGVRIEDSGVVRSEALPDGTHFEVLTLFPKELVEL